MIQAMFFFFLSLNLTRYFTHKAEILKKSKLTEQEFNEILLGLLSKVKVIKTKRVFGFKEKATEIMGEIDKADVIFVATALAFNCFIWSNDEHFKKQDVVKILTTEEMLGITKTD